MRLTVLFVLLLACAASLAETPPPTSDAGWTDAGNTIFVNDELTEIHVTMSPSDLTDMINNPHDNTSRLCTIRITNSRIDDTISNVAIRPRGNTSRNATKKSWKLDFNEFVPGREIHGLEKMNLNGHQNDPSVVRGKLAWDVYNDFGVPSPRASMVHLVINDGSLVDDVYVNVEQIDDEFIQAWFGNDDGNLYQCAYKGARADLRYVSPGNANTYANIGNYQLENDSGFNQHQDLADFIWFIEDADDATFAAEIVNRFSVDNFLRSMAVDAVNGSWDNCWYGANNFFLYFDPATAHIEYIPYDMDNSYGIDFFSTDWATRPPLSFGNGGFGFDYGSPFGGGAEPPLVRRIFEIEAYRDQYLRYIRELVGAQGEPSTPTLTTLTDTAGDAFNAGSDPHFDILSVDASNGTSDLFLDVNLAGPVAVGGGTDQARIIFFFDTRSGGSTSNPWGRAINNSVNADYFLGSWTDGGGGFLLYEWTGSGWTERHASFNNPGGVAQDMSNASAGTVRYTVPLSDLGLSDTSTFTFDCVTTNDRGQGLEPGVDHLSNPSQATPNYDTASNPGPYRSHTLSPFTPGPGTFTDGPFTLPGREASIDFLSNSLAPYAFLGSFTPGNSDYGFTNTSFLDSFTLPASYSGSAPWSWGLKPFIEARTDYLRQNVSAPSALPKVYINELCALNLSIIADELGQFDDFIELYNAEPVTVDLSGMYLSDNTGSPKKWRIPDGTTIPANGFLLVWADNDTFNGPLHASFQLASAGETVSLTHNDANGNVLIDSLTPTPMGVNETFGRFPDAADTAQLFCAVTPLTPNDDDDTCFVAPGSTPDVVINEWLASNTGSAFDEFGEDDDFIELYNNENFTVDLSGMFLTDDLNNKTNWEIPFGVTIPAKGRLLIWADNQPLQGPRHATFKLAAGGESIGLYDNLFNNLAPLDTITFGAQTTNVSQGRTPDGTPCMGTFNTPTPGAVNPGNSADTNGDGILDNGDIGAFVDLFLAGDLNADFNNDGLLDNGDIGAFVAAFLAGC